VIELAGDVQQQSAVPSIVFRHRSVDISQIG